MRRTDAFQAVAAALMANPTGKHWGYQLSKQSDVRSGVLYPMLTRMLDQGLIEDGWEDPATIDKRRPPRRYYQLTEQGRAALADQPWTDTCGRCGHSVPHCDRCGNDHLFLGGGVGGVRYCHTFSTGGPTCYEMASREVRSK